MAKIRSLLNPMMDDCSYDSNADSNDEIVTQSSQTSTETARQEKGNGHDKPMRKKQKVCKDAAVFKADTIRGECRYPPHEEQDDMLAAKHQMYEVYPVGEIIAYPRHIPYNSGKKLFWEKTGRESFEVFQYQFKMPGDSTTYTMIWDYNVGLVRTTPLFKCGNYSKTTPAKMLARNVGLKDLCHSITGGALVAQGYWIPYEAAKAVAATFCWHIRYALTPVFGKDFLDICLPPGHKHFGSMQIDPEITKRCALQAQMYRELEGQERPEQASGAGTPPTPSMRKVGPSYKRIMPKPPKATDSASESSADAGYEDKYQLSSPSPSVAFSSPWSAVNSPRSPSPKVAFRNPWSPATTTRSDSPQPTSSKRGRLPDPPRSHTPLDLRPPPRKPLYPLIDTMAAQTQSSLPSPLETPCTPEISPKSGSTFVHDGGNYYDCSNEYKANRGEKRKGDASNGFTDTQAAYTLMQLAMRKDEVRQQPKSRKRRASA
ncbi:hypothetical protein LTR10_016840 [Elasticomyces elasticus]|uniref:HTH APSES-type domain-containing protein n=1 Tax=Exophiala sideris TaxID=1016849 RepID=A0ABR0JLH6_9EURO|nr:hypothetical protein LTR10_016840 [Elasticomyces elasticus]KAK5035390.1 hypothetical protein LTS07_002827 [Exophiala sideris]KAK5039259.1 hypothetical protein LTR13_003515 [Exophiala sideris]KAK5066314.1 hypothetical protein LTR69_002833 [Exophiala sideris]KAK5186991.1 hypothetical protein LTR44_000998 [Eurotiomycetes sp. CCFEE 6388]